MKVTCIYHGGGCADGFGAALIVKKWADENKLPIEFVEGSYSDKSIPEVKGRDVYIVDFSYPRDVLIKMEEDANYLHVIDHHKTAEEDLKGLGFCSFDMEHSGAMLTWKHFYPNEEAPLLIQYIEDRDLWKWKLRNTKAISAGINLLEKNFDAWNNFLNNDNMLFLEKKGQVIHQYENAQIKEFLNNKKIELVNIANYEVPCVNSTTLASELGNKLSEGYPFAAVYYNEGGRRYYSLRSQKDAVDVSEIAKKFGGGGHSQSSGFSIELKEIDLFDDD